MLAQIFERTTDKITHIEQGNERQPVKRRHGFLRGRTGGCGNMGQMSGAGDINPAMDRMDPGRTGIGNDDAGRTKNGKPADDAKPFVPGLFGKGYAIFHRDCHLDILSAPVRPTGFGNILDNHPAWRRIDGWFADIKWKTGARHCAYAITRPENCATARRRESHNNLDQRTMGDIGVIAGILDDRRPRVVVLKYRCREGEARALTFGENNLDRVWKPPRHQRTIGGPCRRRRAGAGGPTIFKPAVILRRNIKRFGHGRFVIPKGAYLVDRLSHGYRKTTR